MADGEVSEVATDRMPEICDYEGSTYRTDFWEGKGRDYEDRVERIAIRRLLPPAGNRLLELGAGYGRLTPLFAGYGQVVLLDYSRSQLEYARQRYGDQGYLYVAANLYQMPFAPGLFDAATMVRVLHHMEDPPAALGEIRRVMQGGGAFLLEYANKQNLKAILRWLARRQDWSPFDRVPVEYADLNFDFHPRYIDGALQSTGFAQGRALTVSHFRLGLVKRLVPTALLTLFDSLLQWTGDLWKLSPSVFILNRASGGDAAAPPGAFWRCLACGGYDLDESPSAVVCRTCDTHWPVINGVYNFKGAD